MAVFYRALTVTLLTLSIAGCASDRGVLGPGVTVAPPRAAGGSSPQDPTPSVTSDRQALQGASIIRVRVTDARGTRVISLPLEEYVLGAVRAELPPETLRDGASSRLLQVQAIVSRTFAVASVGRHAIDHFDLCDSTHCQIYRPALQTEGPNDPAALAVANTRDQVITYQGHVIQALFHSSCGGHTTSAAAVWGGLDPPYLRPVVDTLCARTHPGDWTFAVAESDLRRALNADPKTAVGDRLDRIDISSRDESGRADLMTLAGARAPVVRSEELRAVISRAFGALAFRSTWFTVSRRGDRFVFAGVGYGHGVGLCQVGAILLARAGQSPLDIITHYFPGTRISSGTLAVALPRDQSHIGEIP